MRWFPCNSQKDNFILIIFSRNLIFNFHVYFELPSHAIFIEMFALPNIADTSIKRETLLEKTLSNTTVWLTSKWFSISSAVLLDRWGNIAARAYGIHQHTKWKSKHWPNIWAWRSSDEELMHICMTSWPRALEMHHLLENLHKVTQTEIWMVTLRDFISF